jgi:hypothetical protein
MGIELTNGDLWGIRLRGKRGFSDFPFTKADVFKRGIQKKSAAEWNGILIFTFPFIPD